MKILFKTIYRMRTIPCGRFAPLYPLVYAIFRVTGEFTAQSSRPDLCAICCRNRNLCCGRGGIKAWDRRAYGVLCRMGCWNQWLTEEESLRLQSRIYARAYYFYDGWTQYFAAYSLGRLYRQAKGDTIIGSIFLVHLKVRRFRRADV